MNSKLLLTGDNKNFVPKEKSREAIKNLLEKRQRRSDAEEAERRKNYVCIINTE
ncbi:hypothetical protein [uncultured Methanobrevibacter sp.]|uniref:hypothetical protein n=1 Tax=uncultured Methanobrevibacter sp. TaxID=253161 RepID=UPI0026281E2C|nr:hypothetical protein [uncultured Methanobrevibacter sp.]